MKGKSTWSEIDILIEMDIKVNIKVTGKVWHVKGLGF